MNWKGYAGACTSGALLLVATYQTPREVKLEDVLVEQTEWTMQRNDLYGTGRNCTVDLEGVEKPIDFSPDIVNKDKCEGFEGMRVDVSYRTLSTTLARVHRGLGIAGTRSGTR